MALLVTVTLRRPEVLGNLRPQGSRQHPAGSLPGDGVQLHADFRLHGPARDYALHHHGVLLPTGVATPASSLATGKVRRALSQIPDSIHNFGL
jgi:hypothetical protein